MEKNINTTSWNGNKQKAGMSILGISDDLEIKGVRKTKLEELRDAIQKHLDEKYNPKLRMISKEFYPLADELKLKIFVIEALVEKGRLYAYSPSRTNHYYPIGREVVWGEWHQKKFEKD